MVFKKFITEFFMENIRLKFQPKEAYEYQMSD